MRNRHQIKLTLKKYSFINQMLHNDRILTEQNYFKLIQRFNFQKTILLFIIFTISLKIHKNMTKYIKNINIAFKYYRIKKKIHNNQYI